MINVLIADDHQLILDGIQAFLEKEKDIHVVGTASNGKEVMQQVKEKAVDVVVLDVSMPEMDGIAATKALRKQHPNIKILIVSMYKKREYILELMRLGVNGYVLKNKSREELVGAIHNVYRGSQHFGLEVLDALPSRPERPVETAPLSKREKEVLRLVGEAKSAKEIASELGIVEHTVNAYWRNLKKKLDVRNVQGLVRYAIKHGYTEL